MGGLDPEETVRLTGLLVPCPPCQCRRRGRGGDGRHDPCHDVGPLDTHTCDQHAAMITGGEERADWAEPQS